MQVKRPSSMPRLMTCPASYQEPEVDIKGDDTFSIAGTIAHDCIETMIRGKSIDHFDKEYRIQAYMVKKFLESLGGIEILGVEERFYWEIEGTADLVFSIGDILVILDWKSGYKVKNYDWQVRCYAIGAVLKYKKFKKFKTITYYTRLSEFDVVDYTREELEGYKALLLASEHKEEYCPSEHCDYCPRKWECKALMEQNRYLIKSFGFDETSVLPDIYKDFKNIQKVTVDYDKLVKARVKSFGKIEGNSLKISQNKLKKATLKADIILDLLNDKGITTQEAIKFFTVSKTKLSELLEKNKINNKEFMDEVREKGALTENEYFKLKVDEITEDKNED